MLLLVVLCLAAQNGWWSKLHIGIYAKAADLFAICMWVYMRLDGSKRSESLPVVISQISQL